MPDLEVVTRDADALEADPVQYMALALNRAKGWLAEAQGIESVREVKAIAVGYESVIREKELAFDAQLSAAEIVRRCERRIGQLIREGQQRGTIRAHGQTAHRPGQEVQHVVPLGVAEAAGVTYKSEVTPLYAMADAPAEQFEEAVAEAREEGNLSRANVVRKVKGEQPKQADRSEWHRKRRHIDPNRVLATFTQELDAATDGLELMKPEGLDSEVLAECMPSIRRSLSAINRHLRRLR